MTRRIEVTDGGRTLLAAGRRFPVVDWDTDDVRIERPEGDVTFRTRRALIAHENGWELSVIWGTATWSTNRDALHGGFTETPTTVEVGVWNRGHTQLEPENQPWAQVTAEALVMLIDHVGTLPTAGPWRTP